MIWSMFSVLAWGVGLFYAMGFALRCVDSAWLLSKMSSFFPLLYHKFPDKATQLMHLGLWSIVMPGVAVLFYYNIIYGLLIIMCLSIWEVYLGMTFYIGIGDIKGACTHMIIHSSIATLMVSYFLRSCW